MIRALNSSFLFLAAVLAAGEPALAESPGPLVVEPDAKPGTKVLLWLETSLRRVYLKSPPGSRRLEPLAAPRNGRVSFQAFLRNDRPWPLKVE